MILMVYTVISPLTNFIIAFVCLGFGTIVRYQFIYIYPTVPDSGGMIWMSFIKILVKCMIVAELTSEYYCMVLCGRDGVQYISSFFAQLWVY